MLVSSSVEILREVLEFSIMMWLKVSVREIWIFFKTNFYWIPENAYSYFSGWLVMEKFAYK